jgi:hypothetical protein
VEPGDAVGRSGVGDSGFPHPHFETRDGGLFQRHAVSPFSFLPYADVSAPEVAIDSVDLNVPEAPIVAATVSLPRSNIDDELDFNALTVSVWEDTGGELSLVDEHTFDMRDWNLMFTPLPPEDENVNMDNPDFNGVAVDPEPFVTASELYVVHFTFGELSGPADPATTVVTATAVDVMGNASEATWSAP